MIPDIRTDHAGETGAVTLYRTLIKIGEGPDGSNLSDIAGFATRHLASEIRHLEGFAELLPEAERTRFLFAWRLTAAASARIACFFGPKAVYATIAAIEDGVDTHFQKQIEKLSAIPAAAELRNLIIDFQADEKRHRDEAAAIRGSQGFFLGLWCALIRASSAFAVAVTRRA
jgi:demethoxyubiquinone hydroxylase (CLK1/Coq7/Cat5 family)